MARVLPALTQANCLVTDVLDMIRPHMEFTFNNILSHINTVFVLRTKAKGYAGTDANELVKEHTRYDMIGPWAIFHIRQIKCKSKLTAHALSVHNCLRVVLSLITYNYSLYSHCQVNLNMTLHTSIVNNLVNILSNVQSNNYSNYSVFYLIYFL